MSIAQNLKLLNKPIAELAMLPQETIMQMAQMGQIPVQFVAPILSEKAQQAEAGANIAAMAAQDQMPAGTVLEGLIAQNAANEAKAAMPEMPEDSGIAALPVDEGMVPEFAGGGIVAFSNGGRLSKEEIERRLREAESGQGPNVSRPGAVNPRPQGVPESLLPQTPYFMNPDSFVDTEDEVVTAPATANLSNIDILPFINKAEGIASALRPKSATKVPTIEEASQQTTDILKASGYDSEIFDKLRQDVEKQRESLKGDRKEAMNLRLIEAGLGIMGGTSPYAFTNIGQGATGAIKGLSQDIKDLKKSESDLIAAQQNLMMKKNDAALGRARVTQSTIDKAQERLDRENENYNRTKAEFTNTLMKAEIQERLAKASYGSKMTDFDKQWALYSKDAKARGEPATLDGFRRALEGSRSAVTDKDATRMALDALKNTGLDLSKPEDRAQFEELKRYFMQQGGASRPSAGGKPPPLPSGFVLQP